MYGTIDEFKRKNPTIEVRDWVTRRSDGKIFETGDIVIHSTRTYEILGFQYYNAPQPVSDMDEPIDIFERNGFVNKIYKTKYKEITRAIARSVITDFVFLDIEDLTT